MSGVLIHARAEIIWVISAPTAPPIAISATCVMSKLTVDCRWEGETVREWTRLCNTRASLNAQTDVFTFVTLVLKSKFFSVITASNGLRPKF